jgi:hypothetical protein
MIRRTSIASVLAVGLALTTLALTPALAAPLPFYTGPIDVPNVMVNSVISNINNAPSLQFAVAYPTAVTGSAGASTCNAPKCIITTESLATAASSTYTETITDSAVAANTMCFASVTTAGTGVPVVANITPSAGSAVMKIQNVATAAAFNNTLTINFFCVN